MIRKYVRFRQNGEVCFGEVRSNEVALMSGCILENTLEETGKTVQLTE